ncbi:MAG TPA: AMP-binding protein [Casimicrobiaceae bacterium]|nr:AMP-binding protein [Casimicrobiaceae bacterium]
MPAHARTIGSRLSEVAGRVPERIAIVERDVRVTYRELDAAANAIARHVLAIGDGRDGRVGLFFERKIPAIESMFGVARSARPYVLLDAGDPAERLKFILQDCEPFVLLTEARLREHAQAIAPGGCAIVDVASIHDCTQDGGERPLPEVVPDAALYLCYTSGSTGRPKGVCQTHRNLQFFVDAYVEALRIGQADRLSVLYTLSFSAANMDVYGSLFSGATLCAYDLRRDGLASLADWLDRERITVLHAVPTVFRELGNRLAPGRVLPHLRAVDLGGESVFASDIDLFRAHTADGCILANQLASTEVGLVALHVVGHRDPSSPGSVIPVGRCPDGVRVLIRRADGSAAATDEVGDLVVCSPHVSPGYWRRPELDAAAFFVDPREPGWRQYASGDLGRFDEAGNLHFLGRNGGRVKVRGNSVDLTEIDAALAQCPGIARAAVLASPVEGEADSSRLVAYVTVREPADRVPAVLRRRLAARLPSYMLPSSFVFLDALPETATGKVDRQALALIAPSASNSARTIVPPRDDAERTVAAVFEELLGIAPIGRDDDFFLLGGDSLLSTELQARLAAAFGVRVGNFHENATVEGVACEVRRMADAASSPGWEAPVLIALWRHGSAPPLFLVHGRHGQAFVSPHFMRLLGDDQPVWAIQARGLDGVQQPHASVEDMAADYLAEIRRERPHGPYFLAALCAGAYVVTAMARALRAAGEQVLPLLLLDPPDRLLEAGYSQMPEERFIAKMQQRRALGGTSGPADNPAYMKTVVRVASAFEQALACHRPLPYDGTVYMLCSRQRAGTYDPADWRRLFTGGLKRFEVGATHADALDPRNPVFASYLTRCVGLIREAAQRTGTRHAPAQ